MKRAFLIVLDSVGIGAAPDAADYGDGGAATLPHLAAAASGLPVPTLERLGMGNIPPLLPGGLDIPGVPPAAAPEASFGALQPVSEGKDTVTGHWELAGLEMRPGFRLFPPGPPSFPPDLIAAFERLTGRRAIGNRAASGTAIIEELGPEQRRTGAWIVYTSADSVFQIAAHNDAIPLEELYRGCEIARTLCDPLRVGRVIARPFRGAPGRFERTEDRRDYAFQHPEPTLLERLSAAGVPVHAVGKIEDIFARRGIATSTHTGHTESSQEAVDRLAREAATGLVMANFIDFDMLYGHRRDAAGYARALRQTDGWLARLLPRLGADDLLILTADHGNDPTFRGTDHTREFVPLLARRAGRPGRNLGIRRGFYDVAQTLADAFGLPPMPRGRSFLDDLGGR
jgi:phosphopentomutase